MTVTDQARQTVEIAARAASDKFAQNILAFDVSEQLAITDAFLLVSAGNERQVKAVVEEIEHQLREEADARPLRREGQRGGRWVLLDYGDVVVHVFDEETDLYPAIRQVFAPSDWDRVDALLEHLDEAAGAADATDFGADTLVG